MCVTIIYCCITNHPQYLVAENNSYSFCSQNCNSGKVMTGLCPTWHRLLSGWHTLGDFPGHPAVNIALAMEGTQVRSLVGELRSHMLFSMAKNKKKKNATLMWVCPHTHVRSSAGTEGLRLLFLLFLWLLELPYSMAVGFQEQVSQESSSEVCGIFMS